MERDDNLSALIKEQVQSINGQVYYSIDGNRLQRILVKLAKGHASYEADNITFDDAAIKVEYDFIFNMSEEAIDAYEEIPQADICPEVGSRGSVTPFIIQNLEEDNAAGFCFWNDVQEGQYRYQVSYNNGGVRVKIVIYEMLYCMVDFD